MGNNPVSGTDPDGGGVNDYYKNNSTGKVSWIEGSGEVEGYTHLSASGTDMSVINAVGADIMKGRWGTFINYFEDSHFGEDWFFKAAGQFPHNSSGFMLKLVDKIESLGPAISMSRMTHSWVDNGGWTESKNELEHHMGMFLIAERFGPTTAKFIGTSNELRGLFINDRQSGNLLNALLGKGGTAFEYRDLENNEKGIFKWFEYHGMAEPYQLNWSNNK